MDAAAAEKLANESGNGFQSRVATKFRELEWAVLLSPFYVDASTDKTRELDMIVEKSFPLQNIWNGPAKSIRVRLFIECKYVAQGTVFWLDSMDETQARAWIHSNTCFRPNNIYANSHHYLTQGAVIAKLFSTEKQKGDENDPMFRTINQCLHGYVHNLSRDLLVRPMARERVTALEYPVVMCSAFAGNFYQVPMHDSGTPPTPLKSNFAFELNYAYARPGKPTAREYFLLDFVDFTHLDSFLKRIDDEVTAAMEVVGDA